MESIPLEHGLMLAATLFCLGLVGVMTRRNIVFVLMSLEIMLNASGLAFIVAGARWGSADGQVMFLMILTLAAAEVAVGLGLIIQLYKHFKTIDIDVLSALKGWLTLGVTCVRITWMVTNISATRFFNSLSEWRRLAEEISRGNWCG